MMMRAIESFEGGWYFTDEEGIIHGPYNSEKEANKALFRYVRWLEHGPSPLERIYYYFRCSKLGLRLFGPAK